MKKNYRDLYDPSTCKQRKGPSSFWMHDPKDVFNELNLTKGEIVLDLGCGPGDYAIEASRHVGRNGMVYALDKWSYLVENLMEEAEYRGIKNIKAIVADITRPLIIESNRIDIVLLSTVLHIFRLSDVETTLFKEIRRVLKPKGRVAILECKKEEQPFGPPMHLRLSPEIVQNSIKKYGFKKIGYTDLGYNYLIQFCMAEDYAAL